MSRLNNILGGMTRVQQVLDANPERRMAALGFDYHEPTVPVELNGAQGPHVAGKVRFCKYCPARDMCLLTEDEDGVWVSRCGIIHTSFASEDVSARNFADDDQQTRDRRVQSTVMYDEQRRELVHISRDAVGEAARNDVLWKAGNRLNQTTIWLKFVRDELPGAFYLTESEVTNARLAMKAACTRWAKEGGDEARFGSPVFWAIAIVLEMVAQRPGGFKMPTPELCELCTLEGLHDFFRSKKGQAMVTDESEFAATKAKGQGRDAQREMNDVKRRHARFDELGDHRQAKLAVLSQLIARARIWPNREATEETPDQARWLGLSGVVRKMQKPELAAAPSRPWAGSGAPQLIGLKSVTIGTDADAPVLRTTTRTLVEEEEAAVVVKPDPDAPLPLAPVASTAAAAGRRAEAEAAAAKVAEAEAQLAALREAQKTAEAAAEEAEEAEVADEDLPDGFGEDAAEWDAMVADAHAKAVAEQRAEAEAAAKAASQDAEAAAALAATADDEGADAPSLRQGRPKWTPIKGELKKATLQQVLRSTQWHDKDREKAEDFWKRWQEESTAWRAEQAEKLRRRKDAEELKRREREKRAKARQERVEADQKSYDEWMEKRSFQRDMSQGAERERKEKRRLGEFSLRSEVTDKRAKTVGKIFVSQAEMVATASGKKVVETNALLDEAAKLDTWVACDSCFKWRLLPAGAVKPQKSTAFFCSQVGEVCEASKRRRAGAAAKSR